MNQEKSKLSEDFTSIEIELQQLKNNLKKIDKKLKSEIGLKQYYQTFYFETKKNEQKKHVDFEALKNELIRRLEKVSKMQDEYESLLTADRCNHFHKKISSNNFLTVV